MDETAAARLPVLDEPAWPDEKGPYLFVAEVSGPLERRLLDAWIERNRPDDVDRRQVQLARLPATRRRARLPPDPALAAFIAADADALVVPLRVVWLAPQREGRRSVKVSDLLRLGDPRDPGPIRQYLTYPPVPRPGARIIEGATARLPDLRRSWSESSAVDEGRSLVEEVARKAWLTLERAERTLRGSRYKVPKFPRETLLDDRQFQVGCRQAGPGQRGQLPADGGPHLTVRTGDRRHPLPVDDRRRHRRVPQAHHQGIRGARLRPRGARGAVPDGPALPAGVPPHPQVALRPPEPPVRPVRERAAPQPHRRRHQHELLPGWPADPPLRGVLHPARVQGQRALQVRAAPLHRLPAATAVPARVVHRGCPVPHRQAPPAEVGDARLRRRGLPARLRRRCRLHPGGDRLRPDPGRAELRRRAVRRPEAAGDVRLDGPGDPRSAAALRVHPPAGWAGRSRCAASSPTWAPSRRTPTTPAARRFPSWRSRSPTASTR